MWLCVYLCVILFFFPLADCPLLISITFSLVSVSCLESSWTLVKPEGIQGGLFS